MPLDRRTCPPDWPADTPKPGTWKGGADAAEAVRFESTAGSAGKGSAIARGPVNGPFFCSVKASTPDKRDSALKAWSGFDYKASVTRRAVSNSASP